MGGWKRPFKQLSVQEAIKGNKARCGRLAPGRRVRDSSEVPSRGHECEFGVKARPLGHPSSTTCLRQLCQGRCFCSGVGGVWPALGFCLLGLEPSTEKRHIFPTSTSIFPALSSRGFGEQIHKDSPTSMTLQRGSEWEGDSLHPVSGNSCSQKGPTAFLFPLLS